jgi:hypothetical protein
MPREYAMGELAREDRYGRDELVPPPRNPAAPPEAVTQWLAPHVFDRSTYQPLPPPDIAPNEQGKVPSGDPRLQGAAADVGNLLYNAVPFGGPVAGGAKVAAAGLLPIMRGALTKAEGRMGALAEPAGIRAYHGSPHDFERFDVSKIGTGEGNQAYGHGLYFAENPAVAADYRNKLGVGNMSDPNDVASAYLRTMSDRKTAIESLRDNARAHESGHAVNRDVLMRAADLLEAGAMPKTPGRTYEVNIKGKPEQFLNWNRPIMEQPQHIVDAVADLAAAKRIPMGNTTTGEGAYGSLEAQLYRIGSGRGGGKAEASAALREAGIPGIRYLDQGSRLNVNPAQQRDLARNLDMAQQELAMAMQSTNPEWIARQQAHLAKAEAAMKVPPATSNYVVFDDKLIDILRKYGLAGLSALPAAKAMGDLAAQGEYRQ